MPKYTIQNNFTTVNFSNTTNKLQFIVIHYTANNGDTAKNNANYFKSVNRSASAHYFVDENPIVWCCVEPTKVAWHCGTTGTYFHKYCRNSNSIGIELCSRINSSGNYYFKENTIDTAARLTADLMKKYNIPESNIIRHYDVTHKICPEPYVRDTNAWNNFKQLVMKYYEGDELTMTQYEELKQLINNQNSKIVALECENKILREAIGWNKDDPNEPALYAYNDSNLGKISKDANEIIGKLISDGKLSVDEQGKFAPLCKAMLRLLIIQNR